MVAQYVSIDVDIDRQQTESELLLLTYYTYLPHYHLGAPTCFTLLLTTLTKYQIQKVFYLQLHVSKIRALHATISAAILELELKFRV